MAEISQLKFPDSDVVYDIKDAVARQMVSVGIALIKCTDASNTPLNISWEKNGTLIVGTLQPSLQTTGRFYMVPFVSASGKDLYAEYVTFVDTDNSTCSWEKLGTTDIYIADLGALAYKNSASGTYTPHGAISPLSFNGEEGNVNVTGTPNGTIVIGNGTPNYTPSGEISVPQIDVNHVSSIGYVASSATGGGSVVNGVAPSATMPVFSATVTQDEILELSWQGGSFSAGSPTQVTLPTFSSKSIVEEITGATSSKPTFTGDGVDMEFDGEQMTSTGKFTPNGTIPTPTFNGTQETIVVS